MVPRDILASEYPQPESQACKHQDIGSENGFEVLLRSIKMI